MEKANISTTLNQRHMPTFNKLFDRSDKRSSGTAIARYLITRYVEGTLQPADLIDDSKSIKLVIQTTRDLKDRFDAKRGERTVSDILEGLIYAFAEELEKKALDT
jgi:hypothetical protein